MLNKDVSTKKILDLVFPKIVHCRKKQMNNIIFPNWDELGLLGMIFRQSIRTKEQPGGYLYEEKIYRVVMRVIAGKVFMTGGRPDTYAWKHTKVNKSKEIEFIGVNSVGALINLAKQLNEILDEKEKKVFADMFCNLKKDLLLITSPAEDRWCVEVTSELYQAGLTACVDEWMKVNEVGEAEETTLNIGDFLIVQKNEKSVYCIRREEFLTTHTIL